MAPSRSLPLSLFCYLTIVSRAIADGPVPFAATWSDTSFGPDGPWQAVEVTIGKDQKLALYPGKEFQSFLLTTDYCNGNETCPASKAHLYNPAQSQVDSTGSTGKVQFAPLPNFMAGLDVQGENAESWVDGVDLGGLVVPNVSLALISSAFAVYPELPWYPLSVGCLGLGAPGTINQSFTTTTGPATNASLIPGYLSAANEIPSNSFSMHIGAVNPPMPGSLYFGGYDQNRIVGDVLTQTGDYTNPIPLKDISIKVIEGSSPFGFDSKTGILSSNSSISTGGLPVSVDGCSPYLTLPKWTCDAIAENLPVDYNEHLGLYIWRTNDPKYSLIVRSASVLEFTFFGGSNTQEVGISVPFRHLNLTLTSPLVDVDQQYFPCYTGHSNSYTLGRAFLQDAFVGANWGTKKWWLAQAPGPNIPAPEVIAVAAQDISINASSNDWKASWFGSWTPLTPEEVQNATTPVDHTSSQSPGLSTGAIAGIGVGVGLAGLICLIVSLIIVLRRRKTPVRSDDIPFADRNSRRSRQTQSSAYHGRVASNSSVENHMFFNPHVEKKAYSPLSSPATMPVYAQPFIAELPAIEARPVELPVHHRDLVNSPSLMHSPSSVHSPTWVPDPSWANSRSVHNLSPTGTNEELNELPYFHERG